VFESRGTVKCIGLTEVCFRILAQSWFETQQSEAGRPEEIEPEEVESVPAGDCPEGAFCQLCHDKFEQFYNEEKEEWHLRHAIVVDDKLYHPVCYKDFKVSLT